MGQESGKPAWPKPAGGYQTITGQRYGRRHAYVSFRPTTAKQKAAATENPSDRQETEVDGVGGEKPPSSTSSMSSMLQAIFPVSPNSVHPEADGNEDRLRRKPLVSQQAECMPVLRESLGACRPLVLDDGDVCSSGTLRPMNGDSYEPAGGEDAPGSDAPLGKLDGVISELGKGIDYLSDLHSYLRDKSQEEKEHSDRSGFIQKDVEVLCQSSASTNEDRDYLADTLRDEFGQSADSKTTGRGCDGDTRPAQTEMVVRPKIRKQANEIPKEKRKPSSARGSGRRSTRQWSCGGKRDSASFVSTQMQGPEKGLSFEFLPVANTKNGIEPSEDMQEDADVAGRVKDEDDDDDDDDDDLWEDLQDCGEKYATALKQDDSSECMEGQLSATWSLDSSLEKEPVSRKESWETLSGLDDCELEEQSNTSSLGDVPELSLVSEDRAALEEGEIPWLSYHDVAVSSSDEEEEEPEGPSRFVHPGLFMLDSNNNLEDDSSVSEDLDAEWRLLDDIGDGFGVVQAISYVDPQLLTYMALEERLAQAMEVALAHLESLAVDAELAHPPAGEDIIDRLPPITVTEDYHGEDQCCAICCSEYVKDEIATALPCNHMFHRRCVTLWLQKSGTCPVCRHVLTPVCPSAPAQTSFVSDHDTPPSDHSAAGTR